MDRDQIFSFYRQRLVADLGISPTGYQAAETYKTYPKPGYQNAPKFCEDTDKSMGTYSFNVPTNLAAGKYKKTDIRQFNLLNLIFFGEY